MHLFNHKSLTQTTGSHTAKEWSQKLAASGFRCYWCGTPIHESAMTEPASATKDHLQPRSKGGSDDISNIVPACFHCNDKKGDSTENEFRELLRKEKLLYGLGPGEPPREELPTDLIPDLDGVIRPTDKNIRIAAAYLRARGQRHFEKYPPEPWEPPLTEEEKLRYQTIAGKDWAFSAPWLR